MHACGCGDAVALEKVSVGICEQAGETSPQVGGSSNSSSSSSSLCHKSHHHRDFPFMMIGHHKIEVAVIIPLLLLPLTPAHGGGGGDVVMDVMGQVGVFDEIAPNFAVYRIVGNEYDQER